jgi:hypothetical protein
MMDEAALRQVLLILNETKDLQDNAVIRAKRLDLARALLVAAMAECTPRGEVTS